MPLLELILLEKVTKFKIFFFHIQNYEVIKNIIKKIKIIKCNNFQSSKSYSGLPFRYKVTKSSPIELLGSFIIIYNNFMFIKDMKK
jgi:hypothetical protein